MKNNKYVDNYIKNRKTLYNLNIKNLLDTNQMDIEIFNSLTNKGLLSDENKIKIAMLFAKQNLKIAEILVSELDNYRYSKEMRIVKRTIQSHKLYDKLSDDQKEIYNESIEYGRYALSIGEFEEAYYIFSKGLYVTKHPIFNYYIGKSFFKKGYYDFAKKYFNKYREYGGEKTMKALLYSGAIELTKKNYKGAKQLYDNANHLEEVLGNSNHYVIRYSIPSSYQNIKK